MTASANASASRWSAPVGPSADADEALSRAVEATCRRIAPSWPLDQFIAVNPWWGFTDQSVQAAAARIGHLCGSPLTMPLDWYLAQHADGHITDAALSSVLKRTGSAMDLDTFRRDTTVDGAGPARLMLLTDAVDARRDLQHQPACQDVVLHAIGQHCASWFDRGQARWRPAHAPSLYATWREIAGLDHGPSLLTGIRAIAKRIATLPEQPEALLRAACQALDIKPDEYETYFGALLLSVNGWAAWCAYLRWQAGLRGETDNHLTQLLAIRLAWEWVLADCAGDDDLRREWAAARRAPHPAPDSQRAWVWQDALELTWQQKVHDGLAAAPPAASESTRPALQAVFCIDVRSEPMRRALEARNPAIRTHGFAGFFGLPIEYLPFAAHRARPQLPGLLAPAFRVTLEGPTPLATKRLFDRRRLRLDIAQAWNGLRTTASGGFGLIETVGLSYGWKLLRASVGTSTFARANTDGMSASECAALRPVLDGVALDTRISLAAGVLRAMSLRASFAPIVLLIGHGSHSTNNPQAAGLDCGACGGHSGEMNARVLANLLNDRDVRAGLVAKGFVVPSDTHFVAGLHNTTTDVVSLFDEGHAACNTGDVTPRQRAALQEAHGSLLHASQEVRIERAAALGLSAQPPVALDSALRRRATDWSQVRPEWGLANNAAMIVAPRDRTKHLNLHGRSFLHDYSFGDDPDESVLELILTAPMVVAHWINMQYYASTVDNSRWGSGNKVLHNVVGANIGVFEGNGGDLRIGLPMQSLHDGTRWVHTPQRLSVWIEAPREAISRIVNQHEKVRQLVTGGWLHLFCIEPDRGTIFRHTVCTDGPGAWVPASPP